MRKANFDNEPDYTAEQCLELARDVWSHLPGTGEVFFAGHEDKWVAEFDKHSFADLLNGLGLIAEEPQYKDRGDKIGMGIYYTYVQQARDLRERNELGVSKYCQERTHIGKYFGVWHFARVMSANKGDCWLSEQVTADHCGLTHDTARRAIEWLVAHGWLDVLVEPKKGKRGTYRPVDHAMWVERHGHGQCLLQKRPA